MQVTPTVMWPLHPAPRHSEPPEFLLAWVPWKVPPSASPLVSFLHVHVSLQSWGQRFALCPPASPPGPRGAVGFSVRSAFSLLGRSGDFQAPHVQNWKCFSFSKNFTKCF